MTMNLTKYFHLKQVECEEETSLCNRLEEADTKVFLCSKHAADIHSATSVCIHTVYSDIAIYAIYFRAIIVV